MNSCPIHGVDYMSERGCLACEEVEREEYERQRYEAGLAEYERAMRELAEQEEKGEG